MGFDPGLVRRSRGRLLGRFVVPLDLPILACVPPRTVWLVGMMGAGKTTLGPALAGALGRPFIDADDEIERAAGRSIPQIFAREGEAAFRALERAALEALAQSGAVVALGGGAIAQPGAAARLLATGTVVYLRARPETLWRRLGDADSRPLLASLTPEQRRARIEALLAERRPAYESAQIAIDTDEDAPERLVATLARRVLALEAA